ncbi:Beta-ketoacyl-ACP reductase [Rickettsiales endosymbiont of Paramecium tredecaurelia]|uniref:beta-ketoacyl-ACP reductase n=1 Tax=Candidatus Sarmatiella mevalonica TaxID=2770581 RepID=UPI001FC86858|nr:beta-ketoacyl-ACP reductase [Candidatus Sarmatiella mevalonica]MBL3284298.1 Beta-ketoacyl-ACP reductase [Candidatus Sarmatiella mevalonica]
MSASLGNIQKSDVQNFNDEGLDCVAIVTGGTRGIGRAISELLSNAGVTVVANFVSSVEKAQQFARETGIKVKQWDVTNYQACRRAVEEIEEEHKKPVGILINNAGIIKDKMLHRMEPEVWHDVLNADLNSCFNMSSVVINNMRNSKWGRIVNISSINATMGQLGQTNYCAAKAGIIGFTKALAKESASKNITVNCVAPGYIDTEMTRDVNQSVMQEIISDIPMGRLGKAYEVANAVYFLCQANSAFITGSVLHVNGGQYMQ